ncbi:MAG: hypothetical protein ACAI38_08055 [Myxococcota bacterium]
MSQNLRAAFRNLVAALVAVIDAATVDGRTQARALHHRILVALRRQLALLAGLSHSEVVERFPAKRETSKVAEVIELRPSQERQQRRVAERRDSSMFDVSSVVPPNVERAVTSQMRASHKNRMTHDELLRFLMAFGVPRGDARGALTVMRARTKRDHVIAEDLQDIQAWIGKGWIDSRRKSLGSGISTLLRSQLGLASDGELAADVVADVLVTRGYRVSTAHDIAAKLCGARAAGAAG